MEELDWTIEEQRPASEDDFGHFCLRRDSNCIELKVWLAGMEGKLDWVLSGSRTFMCFA